MSSRLKLITYRIARAVGVFALFRILTRTNVRILCYHGGCLGDESRYNPKLFMTARTFESRLVWMLENGFTIVSLDDAINLAAKSRERPKLPAVITFDDGWHSTGSELIPLVAKFRLPSTLYLCTQHFEEGWPVVEVAVRYTIWRFECRPVRITGFGEEVDGIYQTEIPQVRSTMCDGIIKWISQNAHTREQVCTALERFAACGGITAPQLALDTRRFDFMTRDELLATQRQGCSIELHGHVHRYPEGDPSALKRDLQRCSATIVKTDLPRPTHYCYPSGTFDFGSASILEELGIRSATTCLPGLINTVSGPSCFFLPRFLDGETVSDIEFEAELSGFAEFFRRLAGRGQTRRPLAPT